MRNVNENNEVELDKYKSDAKEHDYIENLSDIDSTDADEYIKVGVDTNATYDRAGTFIMKDSSLVHCNSGKKGVEISGIVDALSKHDWLKDYFWNGISPEKGLARQWPDGGPKVLWTLALGSGYGGPAIQNGKVYILDRVDSMIFVAPIFFHVVRWMHGIR